MVEKIIYQPVLLKLPKAMVVEIDEQAERELLNRSTFIRQVIRRYLRILRNPGAEDELQALSLSH